MFTLAALRVPQKEVGQRELNHFFNVFGHFSDVSVTFFVTFVPNAFCRTPFAAGSGKESRIANRTIESRAWNRHKYRSEEQQFESNRNKLSQEIDSESLSESHPINAYSDLGIAQFESHDSESLDSWFRLADSVPLRCFRPLDLGKRAL